MDELQGERKDVERDKAEREGETLHSSVTAAEPSSSAWGYVGHMDTGPACLLGEA